MVNKIVEDVKIAVDVVKSAVDGVKLGTTIDGEWLKSVLAEWGVNVHVSLKVLMNAPGGARADGLMTASADGATSVYANGGLGSMGKAAPLTGHAATNMIGADFVADPGGMRR